MTFAEHVIRFNQELCFTGILPENFGILNPFKDNPEAPDVSERFYRKFYHDHIPRKLIIGINPGRFGAGTTGIPFTDPKRLTEVCRIPFRSGTPELSSVFIYDVIAQYGGVELFYQNFYITSMCPLGLIRKSQKNNWVNCNYYDDAALFEILKSFIIDNLKTQIRFGTDTQSCIVLGKKNMTFFKAINEQEKLFDSYVMLEHPRYIEQYKQKEKNEYIEKYIKTLHSAFPL